jgi:hypothetical protein
MFMEQFLTGDIWNQVNKHLAKKQKKIACIAYVTSDNLELTKGDTLICDASDYSIKFGMTSAKVLDIYFKKGIKLYSNQDLHSKLLLTDSFLVIDSANLSKSSAETLTESSVITHDDVLISQAKAFCHNLIKESELLTKIEIASRLKIKVVRRPFKPTTKSKTRDISFGNQYWYMPVTDIGERTYKKHKDTVEKTKNAISNRENIDENDIAFILWGAKKSPLEGEQVITRWYNKNKTQSHIYPPSTILEKQIKDGFTYIYLDNTNTEKGKSWTIFQSLLREIGLEKSIGTRFRKISENDANKIKTLLENKN